MVFHSVNGFCHLRETMNLHHEVLTFRKRLSVAVGRVICISPLRRACVPNVGQTQDHQSNEAQDSNGTKAGVPKIRRDFADHTLLLANAGHVSTSCSASKPCL